MDFLTGDAMSKQEKKETLHIGANGRVSPIGSVCPETKLEFDVERSPGLTIIPGPGTEMELEAKDGIRFFTSLEPDTAQKCFVCEKKDVSTFYVFGPLCENCLKGIGFFLKKLIQKGE